MADASAKTLTVDFKVFGKVQGVFFRKYTHQEAAKLKLVGWCRNDDDGTVVGQAQGGAAQLNTFKKWLQNTGSPKSKVERVEFSNEAAINILQFGSFEIRK
jgi:acylphosphatase